MSTAYALSNEELKRVKNYTDKIKNIIMQNISKSVETKEIDKISLCSELYNTLKPFDERLETIETLDKSKVTTSKKPVKKLNTQTISTKRPVGRPKKNNVEVSTIETIKRPVGRPRKNNLETTNITSITKRPVGRPKKTTTIDITKNPVGRPKKTTNKMEASQTKRPVGRPRKNILEPNNVTNITKRPVGRPKKKIDLKSLDNNNSNSFYSLNYDFTSRKPISYTLFDTNKKVKSWKHLLESVCEDVVNYNDENIEKLLNTPTLKGSKLNYVDTTPTKMRSPLKIEKNGKTIYFETYGSSKILVDYMHRILDCCNLKPSDIAIQLKNK